MCLTNQFIPEPRLPLHLHHDRDVLLQDLQERPVGLPGEAGVGEVSGDGALHFRFVWTSTVWCWEGTVLQAAVPGAVERTVEQLLGRTLPTV